MSLPVFGELTPLLFGEGYEIKQVTEPPDSYYFEDETVFGFLRIYDKPKSLIDCWQQDQDSFLRKHAVNIRRAADKSWNVYCVFLTQEDSSVEERGDLAAIEEDFRGTRKIARSGISTVTDLRQALLPLMKIGNLYEIESEDVVARLREKIQLKDGQLETFLGAGTAEELVWSLLKEKDADE